jgi:hypothetical protein
VLLLYSYSYIRAVSCPNNLARPLSCLPLSPELTAHDAQQAAHNVSNLRADHSGPPSAYLRPLNVLSTMRSSPTPNIAPWRAGLMTPHAVTLDLSRFSDTLYDVYDV